MCNSAVTGLISDVVTERVNGGEMFTAYDITLAVQAKLKSDGSFDPTEHRHQHLRNDVHREIQTYLDNGAYSRQLINVGAPTPAFVYYPPGSDPNAYTPRPRNDTPKVQAPASQAAYTPPTAPVSSQFNLLSTDDDEGDGRDTGGRQPDARGTLTVPVPILAAAGVKPLETVYATPTQHNGKDSLALSKRVLTGPGGAIDHATTYTVDSHGNVRVTGTTLATAKINGGGKTYDFHADGDVVHVVIHS